MRLPRDLGGDELIRKLQDFGYLPTRQSGSHVRLTRVFGGTSQSITVPRHRSLRVGTLNAILSEVAQQLDISKNELIHSLF